VPITKPTLYNPSVWPSQLGGIFMAAALVPDALWSLIRPLLPASMPKLQGGRPRVPDRACLTGILFVVRSGIPWRMLPKQCLRHFWHAITSCSMQEPSSALQVLMPVSSPNLKSFSRGPAKRCLSLVYSWWSRFCLDVVSQEISFFCSRSLATRSAFRSLASLQSA